MAEDDISFEDVEMAINNGRIRHKFTRDPRGTGYEVVGSTKEGREIAIMSENGVRSFIIRDKGGQKTKIEDGFQFGNREL